MTRMFFLARLSAALLATLLVALVCCPGRAAAQSAMLDSCGSGAGLGIFLEDFAGREPPLVNLEINNQECNDDATVEFELTGVTSDNVFVYVGENCTDELMRDGDGGDCDLVATIPTEGQSTVPVELKVDSELQCTDGADVNVWMLAISGKAATAGTAWECQILKVDINIPEKVTGLNASSGESEAKISWSTVKGASKYHIVWASGSVGDAGTGCSGEAPFTDDDARNGGAFQHDTTTPAAFSVPNTYGGFAWVAVAAEDSAGNIGPLSEAVCLKFIPAESFAEQFKRHGGSFDGGCRATPGRRGAGFAVIALALAALLLVRRRRR